MKGFTRVLMHFILIGSSFLFNGCSSKDSTQLPEATLSKLVSDKVQQFMDDEWLDCQEKLMKRANQLADSLLIYKARDINRVSIPRHQTLHKPQSPVLIPLPDTTPVAPLWKKEE